MEVCQGSNPITTAQAKYTESTVYIVIKKYNLNYKSCLLKFANIRDANNFTLYRIVLLRVISVMNTF
mgnify:CR=1 FL=1